MERSVPVQQIVHRVCDLRCTRYGTDDKKGMVSDYGLNERYKKA